MKRFVWSGFFLGSAVGTYVPYLWGDTSFLSMGSIVGSAVFGALGIWAGYRFAQNLGV